MYFGLKQCYGAVWALLGNSVCLHTLRVDSNGHKNRYSPLISGCDSTLDRVGGFFYACLVQLGYRKSFCRSAFLSNRL